MSNASNTSTECHVIYMKMYDCKKCILMMGYDIDHYTDPTPKGLFGKGHILDLYEKLMDPNLKHCPRF